MRKKFKIMYPSDYKDQSKAGTQFKPGTGCMIIMNSQGVFSIYDDGINSYNPGIRLLSKVLDKYDVIWRD